MNRERMQKCFDVALTVKKHNKLPIKEVRNIIRAIFDIASRDAVENNLQYMVVKKFLFVNMGVVSANPKIEEFYAKFQEEEKK